jgi:hypothetical protein
MKGMDGFFWRDSIKLTKLLSGEQCWRNIVDNTKEATAATGYVHVGTRLLGFISKLL